MKKLLNQQALIKGKGEKVKLRELELKDAPYMLKWMHDPSVVEFMNADFASKTLKDCEDFIKKNDVMDVNFNLAIVDDNDKYMGTVSLKNIDRVVSNAEFAITICHEAMGNGFSRFAMAEIIRIGFEQLKLKSIYWYVSKENKRAIRFYDKNNYQRTDVESINSLIKNENIETDRYIWYMVSNNS